MQTTTSKTGNDITSLASSRSRLKRPSKQKDEKKGWISSSDSKWDVDTIDSPVGMASSEVDREEVDGASSMSAAGAEGAAIGMRGPVQATALAPSATTNDVNGAEKDGAAATIDAITAPVDPVAARQETAPSRTASTSEKKPSGKNRKSSGKSKGADEKQSLPTTSEEETSSAATTGEPAPTGEAITGKGEEPSTETKAADEMTVSQEKDAGEDKGSEKDEVAAPEKVDAEVQEAPTPTSPDEDPEFQAVKQDADVVAQGQRSHGPTGAKVKQVHAAAVEPQAAIVGKGQARHVDKMEKAPTPEFDGEIFKQKLMAKIEQLTPKKLKDVDEFKENNVLASVRNEMSGGVKNEQGRTQQDLQNKTSEAPSTTGIERKEVTPLPPPGIGSAPGSINAGRAVPKVRTKGSVEVPLREGSQSLDNKMADAHVTDEQLAKSNEPTFTSALDAKKEAQAHAEDDPKAFRQEEKDSLTHLRKGAVTSARVQIKGMHNSRKTNLTGVKGDQIDAKGKDEGARAKVASDIQGIFSSTKQKVESTLKSLDTDVVNAFDRGAALAKQHFEDDIDRRMEAYKSRRYSGALGWARWLKDRLLGMPKDVNGFYTIARNAYIAEMNGVINGIARMISIGLRNAKTEIRNGQKSIVNYVAGLPSALKKVGEKAAADVGKEFQRLERTVDDKQEELINTLAQKYVENLAAIDARIDEMKEANTGLIDAAVSALTDVINTIEKLAQMLNTILAKIADVVGMILMDPIGFLGHLIDGVAAGFNNFVSNIGKHLISGLFGWLTGAMGPMGIAIPENLFSLEGIFTLVMQVLGLSWNFIRMKAVTLFGEPVVNAMEKGVEIFMKLREGPAAMWEHVKEEFSDLKEMVLDQIQGIIIGEVIEAGVKWILSLLSPASAFVKAAMMIYDFLSFIFTRAAQIADFINSLLDAVAAIATGSVGGAASMVENALARSIPVIIGMLASLLGISDLVAKVQKIIQKIHARIEKAIEKVLAKARKFIKKLRGKGGDEDEDDRKKKAPDGPDERTDAQKQEDLNDGLAEAERLLQDKETPLDDLDDGLSPIKQKYRMKSLEFEVVSRNETDGTELVQAVGQVNPRGKSAAKEHRILKELIELDKPINYKYRGHIVTYLSGPLKGLSMEYDDLGFPIFAPFAVETVKIKMNGNRSYRVPDGDFGNANEAANLDRNKGEKEKYPHHTWHHHEDRETMQLIPTKIHDAFRHSGGVWVIKHLGVK